MPAALPVHAGDAFFVPAGTAHTIGPGMVLCEVQQHSDLTYRVFDYNRVQADGKPRPLHLRQALEVMKFGEQAGGQGRAGAASSSGPLDETYFAACRYFATERWEFTERIAAATSPERFELLIRFRAAAASSGSSESAALRSGGSWLLPAALGAYNSRRGARRSCCAPTCPTCRSSRSSLPISAWPKPSWSRLVHP